MYKKLIVSLLALITMTSCGDRKKEVDSEIMTESIEYIYGQNKGFIDRYADKLNTHVYSDLEMEKELIADDPLTTIEKIYLMSNENKIIGYYIIDDSMLMKREMEINEKMIANLNRTRWYLL